MLKDIRAKDPRYPIDPDQFDRAYPVDSFESFTRWWDFVRPIERTMQHFYPILERHIGRLKAESVLYTEIMITGGQLPVDSFEATDSLAALREWADTYEDESFQIEFMLAIGRRKTAEQFAALSDRTLALYRAGLICGFAVAGPEHGYPIRPFERTLARLEEAGIPIQIHAGEWCGPDSIRDAIEYGHLRRIGHGVSLFQDAELMEIVTTRGIHLEFCPTSNLKTESVPSIKGHPVSRAAELGMSFSVNTDDPGPFECTMVSEYELLVSTFGFDETMFKQIFTNSLEARFQKDLHLKPAR